MAQRVLRRQARALREPAENDPRVLAERAHQHVDRAQRRAQPRLVLFKRRQERPGPPAVVGRGGRQEAYVRIVDPLGQRQHVLGVAPAPVEQHADGAGVLDGRPAPRHGLAFVDHAAQLITTRAARVGGQRRQDLRAVVVGRLRERDALLHVRAEAGLLERRAHAEQDALGAQLARRSIARRSAWRYAPCVRTTA
jgi:hypothetical protein